MDRLSRAERRYGQLLRLYPATYRERFGAEMRQTFRDLYREQQYPAPGFWARLAADAIWGAAAENLALTRSGEMKLFWSHSADQRMLAWGVGLMAPAGLFFVAAVSGVLRHAQLPLLKPSLPVLPVLIAVLPLVALAINAAALARQTARHKDRVLSEEFVTKYFWTLALMVLAAGWLVLLLGHDTIGCAVHNLPALNWAGFQHCAATH